MQRSNTTTISSRAPPEEGMLAVATETTRHLRLVVRGYVAANEKSLVDGGL